MSVNDQEPGSAKAEAQERDSPAATADPTAIFAEESYWMDPDFLASIDAMVAAASHVTVHNKPDTPAKAEAQERDSPAATADPMAIFAEVASCVELTVRWPRARPFAISFPIASTSHSVY